MAARLDPATLEWCAQHLDRIDYEQQTGDIGGQSAAERIASGARMMLAQEVALIFRRQPPAPRREFSEWDARARYSPELASKAGIVAAALMHYLVDHANNNDLPADAWFTIPAAELSAALGVSERRLAAAVALMAKIDFLEVRYDGPNFRRLFRVSATARSVLR